MFIKRLELVILVCVAMLTACAGDDTSLILPETDGDVDSDSGGEIPDEMVRNTNCYTPCNAGAVIDGEFVPCSEEKLMPGCLGDAVCVDGWCVIEDETATKSFKNGSPDGSCSSNCDCAEHGACINGYCGGNCDIETQATDCSSGYSCFKKVCRKRCSIEQGDTDSSQCPDEYYCKTGPDGTNGICMPICQSETTSQVDLSCIQSIQTGSTSAFSLGGTDLSSGVIGFTVDRTEASFEITNNTQCDLSFSIEKSKQAIFNEEGVLTSMDSPLDWVVLSDDEDNTDSEGQLTLVVEANSTRTINISDVLNENFKNWSGEILVHNNENLGEETIELDFSSGSSGYWMGKMYFLANFGSDNLEEWLQDKDDATKLQAVGNAFIKRWAVLKRGEISRDNFLAMLASTLNGSWNWANVKNDCPKSNGACYPFANPEAGTNDSGLENFSDNLDSDPIPSGVVELPVAMALKTSTENTDTLVGRTISRDSLHYAGDPAISIQFDGNADTCDTTGEYQVCLNKIADLDMTVVVGGRYYAEPDGTTCPVGENFERVITPWLLPDFQQGTEVQDGRRYKPECRDTAMPYTETPEGESISKEEINASLASSNPLPDGHSLVRNLELVDGAIIDRDRLFIIFRESFLVELDDNGSVEDFSSYGFMMLRRNPTNLITSDYEGSEQKETRTMPPSMLGVECSDHILDVAGFQSGMPTDEAELRSLASIMIDGVANTGSLVELSKTVHYYCWETGLFDQGDSGVFPCPESSPVTFFYFVGSNENLRTEGCQKDIEVEMNTTGDGDPFIVTKRGTCNELLENWKNTGDIIVDPYWRCDPNADSCEKAEDRSDGKIFYEGDSSDGAAYLPQIDTAINEAFRYKTAFRNRSGKNIGFAPQVCVENSTATPYCYAPWDIEENQERINCAMSLYLNNFSTPGDATSDMLKSYLVKNFSTRCVDDNLGSELCRQPANQLDGFEALNGELLVMLGDEAYTSAFASRFDLAGVNKVAFEGSLFEPGGINLSGVAGYEMYSLYQATQYYQLALDRFYSLLPALTESLSVGNGGFITAETVTNYLDRLIRASTQKSRAWSEVAKRYQGFNRPDLAKIVVQRAYTSTYLESGLITRMMHNIIDTVPPEDEAQILSIIEQAQLRYKAALLEMRDVNKDITDEVNYFGYPPDYIPFPAMDAKDINAFEKLLASSWTKTNFAAKKESKALEDNRDYETSSASFQAELVKIRSNYETQLYEMCGNFEGEDGNAYPAIIEYAYLNPKSRLLADPCGLMGNGAIHDAMQTITLKDLELNQKMQQRKNALESINIELHRVNDVCDEIAEMKDIKLGLMGTKMTLQAVVDTANIIVNAIQRSKETITDIADLSKCSVGTSTDCPTSAWSIAMVAGASAATQGMLITQEVIQATARLGMMGADMGIVAVELDTQCDIAMVNSNATIENKILDMLVLDYEIHKAAVELQLAYSDLNKYVNLSKMIRSEYNDIWQQTINVEAAKNDPNTRIYKNDAVINADRAFEVALKEAYKTTKVYEYYTSQSYAHLVDLFLVRMVSSGDYNLENYLVELEEAFFEFEDQYGNPDTRLAVVSLKDDIFEIPYYSQDHPGLALSEAERNTLFTEKFTDPVQLKENGYTFSFNTQLDKLSPLTRNHKIMYVEAEIIGLEDSMGDEVGRVYLTQSGTGTVQSVSEDKLYYRFPKRSVVVNTFFNGKKNISNANVYSARNLRDRPLLSSEWSLMFDPVKEAVNQDIDINKITDIKLYFYYTDFTALP